MLNKFQSLDWSPGPDMKPNFKVIFFYAYPMPKLSTVKKLLKNITLKFGHIAGPGDQSTFFKFFEQRKNVILIYFCHFE